MFTKHPHPQSVVDRVQSLQRYPECHTLWSACTCAMHSNSPPQTTENSEQVCVVTGQSTNHCINLLSCNFHSRKKIVGMISNFLAVHSEQPAPVDKVLGACVSTQKLYVHHKFKKFFMLMWFVCRQALPTLSFTRMVLSFVQNSFNFAGIDTIRSQDRQHMQVARALLDVFRCTQ